MPRGGVDEQTSFYRRHHEQVAASLRREIEQTSPRGRRALVALAGLPASGKSYVARLLAERLGGIVISSDTLRRRLFIAPSYTRAETSTIFAVAHSMTRQLLHEGHAVIFDATNLRERDRRPLYRLAEEAVAAFVLVHVIAPEHEAYARLERRRAQALPSDDSEADARIYEVLRERYQEPTGPYFTVESAGDLEGPLAEVIAAVEAACG